RDTINTTRKNYLNVISGISQVNADLQAIKSNISSVRGMEASYRVGTETLVNVLNQREKLYKAQTQYASDRYSFIENVLTLKEAAGTLSFGDLIALNGWLIEKPDPIAPKQQCKKPQAKIRVQQAKHNSRSAVLAATRLAATRVKSKIRRVRT